MSKSAVIRNIIIAAVLAVMLAGCGSEQKNDPADNTMPDSYQASITNRPGAVVRLCFDNTWADPVSNGRAVADCSKAVNGISIDIENNDAGGKIVYQAHELGGTWLNEQQSGTESVSGNSSINALRVKLSGQCSDTYNVYTKVYQGGKWSKWALNGETAGDENGGPVSGICVQICEKAEGEPAFYIRDAVANQKMIALTFDDSPSDKETGMLLDILKQNNACATFFVVGEAVTEGRADTMKRIVADGSEIGIHTYSHDILTEITKEEIASTCARCSWIIEKTAGFRPVVMRSPGGNCNADALNVLHTLNLPNILWSVDSADWKNKDSKTIADRILKDVSEGGIILAHDAKETTVEAMKTVIPELAARGYQFVTVSELFAYNGGICAGKQYSQPGKAEDPSDAEEEFHDISVLENEDAKVMFCGAEFDGDDKSVTLNICCDNFTDEIMKVNISDLEINGKTFKTGELLGTVGKGCTEVFEYLIKNESGNDYSGTGSIRFAVEICDKNGNKLSKSKSVLVIADTENETFTAEAE